jgi:hypothetical protein
MPGDKAYDSAELRGELHERGSKPIRRPFASASVCISVLRPGASGQQPACAPPFSTCRRAVCFDVRGIDHLRVRGSSVPSKLPEQVFPDAAPSAQSGYKSLS